MAAGVKSIRILVQIDWPLDPTIRLWDGAGPFVDSDLNVWKGSTLPSGLDEIEQAINGEAYTLNMTLMGVSSEIADAAYLHNDNDRIIGAVVQIMIQPCDVKDQPVGDREVMFTGRIDNVLIDDQVNNKRPTSSITVEVTNRFQMRRLVNGSVLSDADQRARSLAVNPSEPPDRFCERIPGLVDKTINWPRWN